MKGDSRKPGLRLGENRHEPARKWRKGDASFSQSRDVREDRGGRRDKAVREPATVPHTPGPGVKGHGRTPVPGPVTPANETRGPTESTSPEVVPVPGVPEWKELVLKYQQPSTWRAVWQIAGTLVPYAVLWCLMYLTANVSWWITVPLAMLAGLFLVRVFIIFHDCGHGSFFKSRRANDVVGFLAGLLTFTPYYHWRWEHAIHHASAGDLDKRGVGDIWTMTVQEYLESSRARRFAYRLARNPVILFLIAPLYLFAVRQRFPSPRANPRERRSVHWMNLALGGMAGLLGWLYGPGEYAVIQLTALAVGGGAGVWMFYVQHQFEDVYWERGARWDFQAAALQGSSYYRLPRILQWFSGNIGFHHIHHLSSRIPNYNLERCHDSHPMFRDVKPITLRSSLKSIRLRLWDENLRKLVGYRQMHRERRRQRDLARSPFHSPDVRPAGPHPVPGEPGKGRP